MRFFFQFYRRCREALAVAISFQIPAPEGGKANERDAIENDFSSWFPVFIFLPIIF